jgi:hypothetical protein
MDTYIYQVRVSRIARAGRTAGRLKLPVYFGDLASAERRLAEAVYEARRGLIGAPPKRAQGIQFIREEISEIDADSAGEPICVSKVTCAWLEGANRIEAFRIEIVRIPVQVECVSGAA